ncbi:MAG TPA: hypothetical protein PKC52_09390 [Anaerolineales bacterium]|nr:hypothetical protein [Anaerolineales bacterium]HND50075.1 hypothetical protein [Anaerolineales bacterium]
MKKLFSEKMALVYGGLSVCAMIGFIATMNRVFFFGTLLLPINVMPVTHMVQPLFFAGIVFGGLAVLCRWGMNKSTVSIILTVGMLLTGIFAGYWILLYYYGQEKAVVVESKWNRDYNLGYGVVVVESICISNGYLIDVYNGTKIYEQYGSSSWQKRRVGLDALQPGQVVDITFSSFGSDKEFYDLLRDKFPPYGLDVTVWDGAAEITIQRGEYGPVDSQTGDSLCEVLFQQ